MQVNVATGSKQQRVLGAGSEREVRLSVHSLKCVIRALFLGITLLTLQ